METEETDMSAKKTTNKPCERPADSPSEVCGFLVSGGGNMHPKGHCPPVAKPGRNRHARYDKAHKKKNAAKTNVVRGGPVSVGSKGAVRRTKAGAGKRGRR